MTRWLMVGLLLGTQASALTFFSQRLFSGPGLPVGYDLRSVGLLGPQDNFPAGRQFVAVASVQLLYPKTQGTPAPLAAFEKVVQGQRARTHVIYTSWGSPADHQANGTRMPQKLGELPVLGDLRGPWSIWLDPQGRLARQGAAKNVVADAERWGSFQTFACVEGGKVTGTYNDYLLRQPPSGRFKTVFERCLNAGVRPGQAALPFRSRTRPAFVLKDERGRTLEGNSLTSPYALIAALPDGTYGLQLKEVMDTARRTLALAKVPLYVVALPYVDQDGKLISAAQVAASLRADLTEPVYTDAGGTFLDVMSNHLAQPGMLLLFGKKGELIDAFATNTGPYELPDKLPQVLLEEGLL